MDNLNDYVDYIHQNTDTLAQIVFEQDGQKKGYVCPVCGSGSHSKRGDGLKRNKNNYTYTCWANSCFKGKDIIEIYGKSVCGLDDFTKQVEACCERLNLNFNVAKTEKIVKNFTKKPVKSTAQNVVKEDYTDYIDKVAKEIELTSYWKTRGLSLSTVKHFKCGFDFAFKHPTAEKWVKSPRFIISTGNGHFVARDVTDQSLIKVAKAGSVELFNTSVLFTATAKDNVYVTEGEIDAMSFFEVGFLAIALGGTSQKDMLIEFLEKHQKDIHCNLIFALDNDKYGKDCQQYILNELYDRNVKESLRGAADVTKLYCGYKDANDALTNSKDEFVENIKENDPLNDYLKADSVASALLDFVSDKIGTVNIPTGFNAFDKALDGGICEGVYFMGGISSLGKTSLMLQIAHQIANAGNDVLFFSLEQNKNELIAKILSRLSYEKCEGKENFAKTTKGFLVKSRYAEYNAAEKSLMMNCIKDLETSPSAKNLKFLHKITPFTINEVTSAVIKHIEMTGRKPVVFVDYLQILKAESDRLTDKQAVDKNVFGLKALSAEYRIPVFATSSLNRESYNNEITLKSFKESGAVEYSSDVLLGLQFRNLNKKLNDESTADTRDQVIENLKQQAVREIELVILKNRNGSVGVKVPFDFNAKFSYFTDKVKMTAEFFGDEDLSKINEFEVKRAKKKKAGF